MTHLRPKLGKG